MFRDARVMVIGVIVVSSSIYEGKMKRKVHYHAFVFLRQRCFCYYLF